ncbi:Lysosomal Pro-X carboxypeptidase [Lonchura striata]|uniref:Lysosomal Pro-X carboxypeptidase n=1 Tax=Lonchura striata TaxID=40157 RepID=A0A218V617_9PASE|nr:lysosomal Pro-X carboxypeptidase isoform X2 [Lonchura striata domestica]OWK61121.1 Lysosomal Pro-X carboxypeptidase [Lonchura striata domestica]
MLRFLLLLPLLGAAGALPAPLRRHRRAALPVGPYLTRYLSQQIDHFGFDENRTFQQRYLLADQHWKKDSGPILFYTGNEGDIEWFCNNTGFMWDVAEELNAMLVFAEHRYYGESLPFGNESFSDSKHLNYLTSEQALADFAVLVEYLKTTIAGAQHSPVIAIGGSYGGMLAAWFRMKYPHVVVGALAASAPIWQFADLVPCGTFFNIVTNDFKKSGKGCSESIRNSWNAINHLSSTDAGLQWLSNTFHLCSPLKTLQDAAVLKNWLSETWVNLAMVNYPYKADFLQPLPAWPIQAVNLYYNYTGEALCLDVSQTATKSLGEMGWYYQACTEIVMPLCTDGVHDMFEPQKWDFDALSEECYRMWGVRPRLSWILSMYGGKNISSHSNIIFSNGVLDPWSAGGVTQNISNSLVAVVIPDGAHHLDLRSRNPLDPKSVQQARAMEICLMKEWIEKARHGH